MLVLAVCVHIVVIGAAAFYHLFSFLPWMIPRDKHCWQHSLAVFVFVLNQLFPVLGKYRKIVSITAFRWWCNRLFAEDMALCGPRNFNHRYLTDTRLKGFKQHKCVPHVHIVNIQR